jgi:TM2 domain-containing membrane protein YozV
MKPSRVNTGTAYLLWLFCLFGLSGVQRFYTGRPISGLFYLFTWGFFGVGQVLDLIWIPGLVEKRNIYLLGLHANRQAVMTLNVGKVPTPPPPTVPVKQMTPMQKLLLAAKEQGGQLSSAQAAFYTELEPAALKQLLDEAQRYGYAEVMNDPETGAVRYQFDI